MLNRQLCFIVLAPFHQCLSRPHHQLQMEIRARVHACAKSREARLSRAENLALFAARVAYGTSLRRADSWSIPFIIMQIDFTSTRQPFKGSSVRAHRQLIYGVLSSYDVRVGERAKLPTIGIRSELYAPRDNGTPYKEQNSSWEATKFSAQGIKKTSFDKCHKPKPWIWLKEDNSESFMMTCVTKFLFLRCKFRCHDDCDVLMAFCEQKLWNNVRVISFRKKINKLNVC